jgi:hypothetical protein
MEKLDIRTITMGIGLRTCADPSLEAAARKAYDKICRSPENSAAEWCAPENDMRYSKRLRSQRGILPRGRWAMLRAPLAEASPFMCFKKARCVRRGSLRLDCYGLSAQTTWRIGRVVRNTRRIRFLTSRT